MVRELRSYLPAHVNAWIDEGQLVSGDSLEQSLRNAIQADVDFLVVFLDEGAIKSEWVRKELAWAREQEDRLGRPFIVPILIDETEMGDLSWVTDRVHLKCHGFRESDIARLAAELSSDLFAALSRDLERIRQPVVDHSLSVLDEADKLLQQSAHEIRSIVFPYRKANPLRMTQLLERLGSSAQVKVRSANDLQELLFRLRQRRLLSGIVVSGSTIHVEEEHLNWRSQEALAAKQAAADAVTDWIDDGQIVFLDAGSTTIRICRNIGQGVRFRRWQKLTVVTNSVPVAGELAEVANDLGLEDNSPRLQVYVAGGRMRMNTSCIVSTGRAQTHIATLADELGGFDIAFVGTNGVWWPDGCTTTAPLEASGKKVALLNARRRVVLAESSKYDVRQEEVFGTFDMDIELVTAADERRATVEEFAARLGSTTSKITIVE